MMEIMEFSIVDENPPKKVFTPQVNEFLRFKGVVLRCC